MFLNSLPEHAQRLPIILAAFPLSERTSYQLNWIFEDFSQPFHSQSLWMKSSSVYQGYLVALSCHAFFSTLRSDLGFVEHCG